METDSSIWDEMHREISYLIMARMRINLHIEMNPTVAQAYVILSKYYTTKTPKFELYIALIASFLIALKNEEKRCDIRKIFLEFAQACYCYVHIKAFEISQLIETFECKNFENVITSDEESKVTKCELDILKTLDFQPQQNLPFSYIDEFFLNYITFEDDGSGKFLMSQKDGDFITQQFVRNASLFFTAPEYFDIPLDAIAAYSLYASIPGKPIPDETKQKLKNIIEGYGKEKFLYIKGIADRQFQQIRAFHPAQSK